ncbi:zinc finger protein RFP-like [Heteronotia binoei]|uniref:zinc finger protein RFP-like n=1 Tax=Heteronotia binoei TaxID=13085 RepID=UPI00292FAF3F|nr:zinc finger protein RFP-like [Heteronotia binoei]
MASAPPSIDVEKEVTCPICLEWLTDPVVLGCGHSFCRGCITSYCEAWERLGDLQCPVCKFKFQKGDFRTNWQLAILVEKMKLLPLSPGNKSHCLRHKKKLHLFCREDEKLLCFLCERSPEHQGHTVLLLEDAAQQQKDKIFSCLETLNNERKKIPIYTEKAKDESRRLLKITELARQEAVAGFRTLHQLLKEQEKRLLTWIEEVEKEVARKMDTYLATLSKELSSLENLIWEMEKKQQQEANELLQDVRSTLQKYEKKETFVNPKAFPPELKWKLWDCCDSSFLGNTMKQLKDSLARPLLKQKAMVTLDPASASSHVVLSGDWKSMKRQSTAEDLSEDPEKHYDFVLGRERFTSGCHFWEVVVGSEDGWAVGVARKSVRGRVSLTPEEGIWAVGRWKGQYKAFIKGKDPPLPLRWEQNCIRVHLNYAGGRVAFFDADRAALLYEFSGASFCGEPLHPFFAVYGDGYLWIHF